MYVVTFYSFKGGTGRTMAMVNVAIELIRQGSSVLMVDFDLEAPGLDTFCADESRGQTKGVVDFVESYLNTSEVPDVRDYVYEPSLGQEFPGKLSIMPAGAQNEAYDARFKSIDWSYLYDQQDGFLLFEDLKEQWKQILKVDYVLVDSRTGHTDIGGICTRQLPDAVAIFFFPNEQNRRGLKTIVDEIRGEASGPLHKTIKTHFVMSNVPDLDDEEEILAANVEKLQRALQYDELAVTVHHYNSLLLLDQAIFTLQRPRSRLAQEYRTLARKIRLANLEDREGVLEFLEDVVKRLRSRRAPSPDDLEKQLQEIIGKHPKDGEILRLLARLRRQQRRWMEAIALLDQAISTGLVDSDVLLARAELHYQANDKEAALSDVSELLRLPSARSFDLQLSVRLLIELGGRTDILLDSPTVGAVEPGDLMPAIQELESAPEGLPVAAKLLERILSTEQPRSLSFFVHNQLMICLIGQGKFAEAKMQVSQPGPGAYERDIYDSFNYAMAEWAQTRCLPVDLFERVLSLHRNKIVQRDANYHQCLAITFWAVGDLDSAFQESKQAYESVVRVQGASFSCWSYLNVHPGRFFKDIAEMDRMVNGQQVFPAYMVRAGIDSLADPRRPRSLQFPHDPAVER